MSMGLTIFASGHKRYTYKHSQFMNHSISNNPSYKRVKDLEISVEFVRKVGNLANDILYEVINKENLLENFFHEHEDFFFDAEFAIKQLGLCEEINEIL